MKAPSFNMTEPPARRPRRRAANNHAAAAAAPATYNLFFSHKTHDQPVTKSIISLIEGNTENVRCFISEDIEKGTNWHATIVKNLKLSNFLVLVFTDPEEDWGWCLYETGFFYALTQIPGAVQTRRIYCLHNASTTPPSPIAHLQSIPATPTLVTKWLEELFDHTKQNKRQNRDNIPQTSNKICDLFKAARKPIYTAKSLYVSANSGLINYPDDLPGETIIKGEDTLIQEIFGAYSSKIDWRSAKERFLKYGKTSESNLNALKELSRAVYFICKNDAIMPVQSTIFVGDGPKRYRPVISHAEELSTGSIGCKILLVDDVGGPLQNVDKSLGVLLTCIRMAVRLRWEIIRPFVSNLRWLVTDDPRKLRFDLQTCLNNIFLEAEFRGIYALSDVWKAFESDQDRSKIAMMNEKFKQHTYPKIWKGIGFPDVTLTFGKVSDQPFSPEDLASLEAGLRELEEMNKDFLDIAVGRAAVLIESELGIRREADRDQRAGGPENVRVLARWNTYVPYGEFRIKWAQKSHEDRYDAGDMEGEATVSSGNQAFLRLFKFGGDSVPDPDGADGQTPLTLRRLMDRIRQFSSKEDFAAFDSDQKRVVDEIIMKDGYEQVKVPIRLCYPEDQDRKRTFQPLLVAKRTVGDTKGPHATYLFVTYAETTADAGSFRSATVESLSGRPVLSIASDSSRSAAD
jgi:hypothetical protein